MEFFNNSNKIRMVFVLEFCLENPNTIFSVISKDFENYSPHTWD
ncbi:hypothetical protein LEP1GSC065_2341 [Leptospira kirschneri serovar Sokoine str. RM1]|nr:hypothetical protein LEP1GSC065_2341 [Leptospira kirschneri serovar Sokoine str. RM1]